MQLTLPTHQIFIPDGAPREDALTRTTDLAISAHQDDIEIMAAEPILRCFQQPDQWFTGVVVTDGRGSPRDDLYAQYSDEEMHTIRILEQKKAAYVGEYAAQILLDYPSETVKNGSDTRTVTDLVEILNATTPTRVYTHNLADKHDTHVAVALKVITAIRCLPETRKPRALFGCEVWRGLDWMVEEDKVVLETSSHENIQNALLGVFDSQICGGKRYDLASMGRRKANATYFASHGTDQTQGLNFAMDLTPLIQDPGLDIRAYIQAYITRFKADITGRLLRVG
jgi:LmbE family N-acetylglucosaminyl deacetylase